MSGAPKANEAGSKLEEALKHETHKAEHAADHTAHSAEKGAKAVKKGDTKGLSNEDKSNLAKLGAGIAVVVGVAFGGYAIYQRRKESKAEREARETEQNIEHSAKKVGRWFGHRAHDAKSAAGDAKEAVREKVHKATDVAGDKFGSIKDKVTHTSSNVSEKAQEKKDKVAHDTEYETKQASKRTHEGIHGAYDKVADKASQASHKVTDSVHGVKSRTGHAIESTEEEVGDFFSGIKRWFAHRRDEAAEAAAVGRRKQAHAFGKAKHETGRAVDAVDPRT